MNIVYLSPGQTIYPGTLLPLWSKLWPVDDSISISYRSHPKGGIPPQW